MKRDEEEEKVEQVETFFLKSCAQWRKYEIQMFMKRNEEEEKVESLFLKSSAHSTVEKR